MPHDDDDENTLADDELQDAREWTEEIGISSDGAYIEVNLVTHLVAEVDRLRDRIARLEEILAEQRRIMGERQPSLFPPDEDGGAGNTSAGDGAN